MPKLKLKPKKILSRLVLGKSRKEEDGIDYLCFGFGRLLLEQHSHAYIGNDDDNADDDSSIVSFSTTATANDLPGTGRFIDTYFYQPMGRRIERLAMRFTISSLHPARIAQYIEADSTDFGSYFKSRNLHDAIANLCYWRGSTVVAGMKGLVKQTQSDSINRSALALAALIRVSLTVIRREIYDNVYRIEPIFHLEILAGSLDCSHPEKMFFVLLVKLARATLSAIRDADDLVEDVFDPYHDCMHSHLTPLLRQASDLRRRLRGVLDMYKLSGYAALDATLAEACDICAVAISTCIGINAKGEPYMHILETVYLAVIFILRSIFELAGYTTVSGNNTNNATRCNEYYFNINALHADIMFRSLVLVGRPLLPESFILLEEKARFDMTWLPRKQRATVDRAEDDPILHSLVDTSIRRTRRLLFSFSELEREAQGCSSHVNGFSQSKIRANSLSFFLDEYGEDWWDSWEDTLEQARRVQVPDNALTKEFREARRIGLEDSDDPDIELWDVYQDQRNWGHYALRKIARHQMGQYYRSNMEWDWDLGTCMKRLFKESHPKQSTAVHGSPASSPTIRVAAGPEGALQLSIGRAQACMPNEIQVSYQTEDGKMEYMSFVPATPGPGHRPVSSRFGGGSSHEDILDPTVMQQDSGHREGSSGREKEIEDLAAGISLLDASQPEAYEVIAIEERKDICEGSERKYDGGGDDAISICSLD